MIVLPILPFIITILEFNEISATFTFPLVYVKVPVLSDDGVNTKDVSNTDFVIELGTFVMVGKYFTIMVAVTDFEV